MPDEYMEIAWLAQPAGAAFLLCLIICPLYIRWLKSKQIEQYIREEGPQSHAGKARTPTMGGLAFIAAFWLALAGYFFVSKQPLTGSNVLAWFLPSALATVCALVGMADDYGKVTSKSNKGISARSRLLLEFALGAVLGGFLLFGQTGTALPSPLQSAAASPCNFGQIITGLEIKPDSVPREGTAEKLPETINPFMLKSFGLSGPWLYLYALAFIPFVFAGAANALNLHDGMDGLAAGTSFQVFFTLAFMCWMIGNAPAAAQAVAAGGAVLGFLAFNRNPAQVFMGDTGSLFIGALMATLFVSSGLVLWLVPLGAIYVVEALSVMAQVVYFKLTKPYTPEHLMNPLSLAVLKLTKKLPGEGKRLLRMAPIHHHFEAQAADKGIKEWEVVLWFWLAQLALVSAVVMVFRP